MSYVTQYDLAYDETFVKRVTMAMLDYCHDVSTEDPGTANHDRRLDYASSVVREPGRTSLAVSQAICAFNASLSTESTDGDIKSSVASLWDLFAGV